MDRPRSMPETSDVLALSDARATTLTLLAARAPGATICPSEVARALATAAGVEDWRGKMAGVHAAVDAMVAEGVVRLSWKGAAMAVRKGPYRIARGGEWRADRLSCSDA